MRKSEAGNIPAPLHSFFCDLRKLGLNECSKRNHMVVFDYPVNDEIVNHLDTKRY